MDTMGKVRAYAEKRGANVYVRQDGSFAILRTDGKQIYSIIRDLHGDERFESWNMVTRLDPFARRVLVQGRNAESVKRSIRRLTQRG